MRGDHSLDEGDAEDTIATGRKTQRLGRVPLASAERLHRICDIPVDIGEGFEEALGMT